MTTTDTTSYAGLVSPVSDFSLVPKTPEHVWVFQAVPERYDLEQALRTTSGDNWQVKQNKTKIAKGHLVLLWKAGENAGIYGIAKTTSEQYDSKLEGEEGISRIDLQHIYTLPKPILRRELVTDPITKPLQQRIMQGTNFKVEDSEWAAIYDLLLQTATTPTWWWVNQRRTYETEKTGGFVFAVQLPRSTKHHEDIKDLKPGDFLIHYADSEIKAIGCVQSNYTTAERHEQLGWSVDVLYSELKSPISLKDIPDALRKSEKQTTPGSVFDTKGGVRQGYLFPVSDSFVSTLSELLGSKWTEGMPLSSSPSSPTDKANTAQCCFRIWNKLVETAQNKSIISAEILASAVNIQAKSTTTYLQVIQSYCREEKLPALTNLVTNKDNISNPSSEITQREEGDQAAEQRRVWEHNWSQVDNPFAYAEDGTTEDEIVRELFDSPEDSAAIYGRRKLRGAEQSIFKKLMRRVYENRCAFCGLSFLAALEAAHLIPWTHATRSQRIDPRNGILLCSTHHRLFDANHLRLDESYKIVFCGSIDECELGEMDDRLAISLDGKAAWLPPDDKHRPSKQFLAARSEVFNRSE